MAERYHFIARVGKFNEMRTTSKFSPALLGIVFAAIVSAAALSCKKSNTQTTSYTQVNLVADTSGYGAMRIDTNLDNPWGIAFGATGAPWINANHGGLSLIYDGNGNDLRAPVTVADHGDPTGIVFNATTDFVIPGMGQVAKFIFVGEDGLVTAWSTGDTTVTVADRSSSDAIYKGIAMANDGSANYLYAADFHNARVDVFDKNFSYVAAKTLTDPNMPAGFAPFNIQNIDGQLYVSYAKQEGPDNEDDESGMGNGYVDIYKPDGSLVKRFASQGTLNSPWGIVKAPASFGQGDAILIGNFGDGRINVFNTNGTYKGQLMTNGNPIAIEGLWAIVFPPGASNGLDPNSLYFTAAPGDETFGIFGYLKKM